MPRRRPWIVRVGVRGMSKGVEEGNMVCDGSSKLEESEQRDDCCLRSLGCGVDRCWS